MRFLLVLIWLVSGNFQTQSNLIPWSDSRKLQWKDFKGVPEADPNRYAMTRSGIYTSFLLNGNNLTVTARSAFDMNLSWVKNGIDTLTILEHEQLHFDITELLARQFKKAVSEKGKFKLATYKNDLLSIKSLLSESYVITQDAYDKETYTSRSSQAKWKERIAAELLALEAFKGQQIKVLVVR